MVSGSRDGTRRNAAEFMAEGLRNSFTAHLEKDFPFSRDACLGDENVPKKTGRTPGNGGAKAGPIGSMCSAAPVWFVMDMHDAFRASLCRMSPHGL